MKNKYVGLLMIGISIIIGIIVFLFNNALTTIVNASCTHGTSCPMYGTINIQTYISLSLVGIIIIIGVILLLSKEERQIIVKKVKEKKQPKKIDVARLDKDEKVLVKIIADAQGTIFQSELVEKSGFDKVKVTRILDKLEGKQFIERKRRGMTNVVILK